MISPWKNSCVVCKNKQMYEYYLSVGNWKANMKVIILLATFAFMATLDFVSTTSSVCDEPLFPCMSGTRYHEYLVFKDELNKHGKCPRRVKKILKLRAENKMQFAWKSMICQQRLPVKSHHTFSIILFYKQNIFLACENHREYTGLCPLRLLHASQWW